VHAQSGAQVDAHFGHVSPISTLSWHTLTPKARAIVLAVLRNHPGEDRGRDRRAKRARRDCERVAAHEAGHATVAPAAASTKLAPIHNFLAPSNKKFFQAQTIYCRPFRRTRGVGGGDQWPISMPPRVNLIPWWVWLVPIVLLLGREVDGFAAHAEYCRMACRARHVRVRPALCRKPN
jgi:hypothetical protein